MLGTVNVARTQVRRQKMVPTKNVQRQKTVAIIETVEGFVFLVAVNAVIGGVDV
jgi:hypothetical protein